METKRALRLRPVLVLVASLAGCYKLNVDNGQLLCSPDSKCPKGFHCAVDNTCWMNGQDPKPLDLSATSPDGDMPVDACVSSACKAICVVDDPNSKVDDVCVVGP